MAPQSEWGQVLPQILSIYAVFYYMGSVTRYRPDKFNEIMKGKYSAQLQEIIVNLPSQFLYLVASEFAKKDVTRAAII